MEIVEDKNEELEQYMFNSFNQRKELTHMIRGYGELYVPKCKQVFSNMELTLGHYANDKTYSVFLNELVNDIRFHIENDIIKGDYTYSTSCVKSHEDDMGKLKYLLVNLENCFGLTMHDFYMLYGGLLSYLGTIPLIDILHPSISMFEPQEEAIELWNETVLSVLGAVKTVCLLAPNVKGIKNYHDILTVSDGMLGSDVFIEEAKEYALNKPIRNKYLGIKIKTKIKEVIKKVKEPLTT